MIYDRPMTKAEADRRYKDKMKGWKDRNYLTFMRLKRSVLTQVE